MRKIIIVLFMSMFTSVLINAEDTIPQVSVTASGEISVTPDILLWSCTVKTTAADLSETTKMHTSRMQTALRYLTDNGVDEKDLQTTRMNFRENWNFKAGSRVKNGYVATSNVNFKISDLGKYNELWAGLSKIEGLSVNNVSYDHSDNEKLQKECLKKALLNAKEKAVFIAETLGEKVGRVLKVVESGSSNHPRPMMETMSVRGGDQTPSIAPGELTISKQVSATFMLIQ